MLLEKGFAWNFAKKCGIKCSKKWYQHMLKTVSTSANCNVKLVLHVEIDGNVSQNRPEITIKVKDARKWYFVDVMVPQDHHVGQFGKHLELVVKAQTKSRNNPSSIGVMGIISKWLKTCQYFWSMRHHRRSTDFHFNWEWKDTEKSTSPLWQKNQKNHSRSQCAELFTTATKKIQFKIFNFIIKTNVIIVVLPNMRATTWHILYSLLLPGFNNGKETYPYFCGKPFKHQDCILGVTQQNSHKNPFKQLVTMVMVQIQLFSTQKYLIIQLLTLSTLNINNQYKLEAPQGILSEQDERLQQEKNDNSH